MKYHPVVEIIILTLAIIGIKLCWYSSWNKNWPGEKMKSSENLDEKTFLSGHLSEYTLNPVYQKSSQFYGENLG